MVVSSMAKKCPGNARLPGQWPRQRRDGANYPASPPPGDLVLVD